LEFLASGKWVAFNSTGAVGWVRRASGAKVALQLAVGRRRVNVVWEVNELQPEQVPRGVFARTWRGTRHNMLAVVSMIHMDAGALISPAMHLKGKEFELHKVVAMHSLRDASLHAVR
jgi:hypothetical protein